MGSSISTSGGKYGEEWKSKIYFDPEADSPKGAEYQITDDKLKTMMDDLIENEKIIKISVYKVSLSPWQWTNWIFFHALIVIRTHEWRWSIEKNSEGITVQRSKDLEFVKDRYRRKNRPSYCTLLEEDDSNSYLTRLVDWLYQSNQLNKKYHWLKNNCKHFAEALFNEFAKDKRISIL